LNEAIASQTGDSGSMLGRGRSINDVGRVGAGRLGRTTTGISGKRDLNRSIAAESGVAPAATYGIR